jgi:hypothetical protein
METSNVSNEVRERLKNCLRDAKTIFKETSMPPECNRQIPLVAMELFRISTCEAEMKKQIISIPYR